MAGRQKNNGATLDFKSQLWAAADKLRGHMDSSEYKHVVLGLIFLKYISDSFEEVHAQLLQENDADPEDRDEYLAKNVFWMPQEARWSFLRGKAKQPEIGKFLDDGMTATEPTITETPNPPGSRVAIVSTHKADGGAWVGLIPAVARAVEYSGDIPLSIRFDEIKSGKLTLSNFKVVIFPGGYSYGYKIGLSGYEVNIKNFATAGGGVMGICAGSFYLSKTIVWDRKTYTYTDLFKGADTGPLTGLNYPSYTLTSTILNDPLIGNFGSQTQMYYGGGYKTNLLASNAAVVASYTYRSYNGQVNAIRFMYGSGHVLLIGTHPESRSRSNEDWLMWDNYVESSNTPLINPDNPWIFFKAVLDNWLTK